MDKELKDVKVYGKSEKSLDLKGVKYPKGPKNKLSDSGTAFVIHAIEEGYDEIYLIGFDLGGKDIYQHKHHLRNKKSWVKNWRYILEKYGLDKVHFIGYDHKKILLSKLPDDYYAKQYMRGKDHLENYYTEIADNYSEEYKNKASKQYNNKKSNRVLILGNGKSRNSTDVKRFIKNWTGELWGCNKIYTEYTMLPKLDRVGTVYNNILNDIRNEKEKKNVKYEIYTDIEDGEQDVKLFQNLSISNLTSTKLIEQAIYEEYEEIYLAGFDFGGINCYNRKTTNHRKMIREMKDIIFTYGINRFHFLKGIPKILL